MTEENLAAIDSRSRHRTQPVEMTRVELSMGRPVPRAHLLRRTVDQVAVVIAEYVKGVERHQRIHGSPRIERAARHVTEMDDVADALRADIRQHGFECEI